MIIKDQLAKLFLIATLIVSSCTKAKISESSSLPPSTLSPLSGQEFLFETLTWMYYNSGAGSPWWDEVYLTTPSLSNLLPNGQVFKYGYLQDSEVHIKLDNANDWTKVKPEYNYDNTLPVQYLYTISGSRLVVNVWPADFKLAGKKASIKINFK